VLFAAALDQVLVRLDLLLHRSVTASLELHITSLGQQSKALIQSDTSHRRIVLCCIELTRVFLIDLRFTFRSLSTSQLGLLGPRDSTVTDRALGTPPRASSAPLSPGASLTGPTTSTHRHRRIRILSITTPLLGLDQHSTLRSTSSQVGFITSHC
jgi:hypothetical protein